ncbi:MAG: sugar ABC transporter permease [Polyangiaceae bacterium]|nr:sugar ABC transporter permease [Polyangiaceae bacterium]
MSGSAKDSAMLRKSDRVLYAGWAPYGILAPYLLLTSVFFVVPFVNAIVLAFYETNGPRARVFVGLGNFRFLLHDPMFFKAFENTTVFALASVFLQLPLSLGLALLLNASESRWKGVFRLILFSPNLVGQVFVGILFSVLFTPRFGLINRTLQALVHWGLEERWLVNPSLVMPALILTSLWVWVGFNMVYFLAALQGVDKTIEEAARIDGAGALAVFWHVTLPSIRHVVVFVVITCVIGSFQLFELPVALLNSTDGFGPDNSGLTLITYLYEMAFRSGDLGLGAAVGWIVTLVIFTVSIVQIRVSRVFED